MERKTLADVIFSKLNAADGEQEKSVRIATESSSKYIFNAELPSLWHLNFVNVLDEPPDPKQGLSPKIVEVFTK